MRIDELRREPDRNPRIQGGHVEAVDYLNSLDYDQLVNTGVHLAELPKVGVNPGSKYNTPMGIYFYPAMYYLMIKNQGKYLPFADPAPYIHIMHFRKTNNTLHINKLQPEDLDSIADELAGSPGSSRGTVRFLKAALNISEDRIYRIVQQLLDSGEDRQDSPKVMSPGGYVWFLMWKLSQRYPGNKPAFWNKLIRVLGYDIVIDTGAGIIHENEPSQGFIADPRVITGIKTIQLKYADGPRHKRQTPLGILDNYQREQIIYRAIRHAVKTNTRNRKLESWIIKYPPRASVGVEDYAAVFFPHGWPEYEATFTGSRDMHTLMLYVNYCVALHRRMPVLEEYLLELASPSNPTWPPLDLYYREVMLGYWPELEAVFRGTGK